MPVSLFTGLPGSGKTASLVKRITELLEKEPGRPIFQYGINGLKEGLAITLTEEMLHKWWELPAGSIICLDECQEDGSHPGTICLMPKDNGRPSEWVQRITKVRHYGMDFLLTTQHPANMSAYVRRLVDSHVHSVMRAKGVRQTFSWMRCIDDPDSRREKKVAEMSFAPLPKEVFELYKSSSLHTMKVKTPRIVYIGGALVLTAVALAIIIPYRIHKHTEPVKPVVAGGSSADAVAAQDVALRQSDYVKWMKPRVAGVPWTAPAFDTQTVKSEPRLFCIAVDDGRCTCLTEQGTHYEVEANMCRTVAREGIYNPFVAAVGADQSYSPSDSQSRGSPRQTAASPPDGRAPLPGGMMAGDVASSQLPHAERQTATSYTPPEYHAWNSDPFGGANKAGR
ncbi:zonular occludens toxin domain-containing protein [Dyella terrae]|uniref:zonular occludens toxin domain-containing protein n=1 Tax=Dyella terrae TaxID=522259 RepID=UPI0023D8E2A6|nr:zonular occludens toxin domain-containing protein [Dyella terrae]ULU23791.1 Zonular occludens toxin [Dyella terrae]